MAVRGWIFALMLFASPALAQTSRPIPAGLYRFVPGQSESVDNEIDDTVSRMNFLIRGIARNRLEGANRPIERIDIRYSSDTVWISLRPDEPWAVSTLDGAWSPYGGSGVRVRTEVSPGAIHQYFRSDEGGKEIVYRLREDGRLAVESIIRDERLPDTFAYTWVYRPVERSEG